MLTVAENPSYRAAETFPSDGELRDQLDYIARYAEIAPELFGTRPWTLRVTGTGIDVVASSPPRLRKVDFDGRESTIAIGAAVFLLRLALRCHLLDPEVQFTPDFKQPSLLARLTIVGRASPSPIELELFALLTGDKGETVPVPPLDVLAPDFQELEQAACQEGVLLRYIEDEFLRAMTASMLQPGDCLYYQREQDRDTFKAWLGIANTPTSQHSNTSLDFVAWTVSEQNRTEFSSESDALKSAIRIPHSAIQYALAVLCTTHDDEGSWLQTGQALGRVHLLASALGMKLSAFNQPLQVPGMRARFARETGFCSFPQVVVQIGFDPGSTARRRNLHEVLLRSSSTVK
ncbi:MAG: hypothetical protein ACHQ50_09435 [Fimbriimonadales bacterium]